VKERNFSIVLIFLFFVSATGNAYDVELYQKWQESYLKSTDVVLNLRLVEIKSPKINKITSRVFLPENCKIVYEVQSVESQPSDLDVLPGDLFLLKYPCNSENGSYRGPSRSFPWIKKTGDFYQAELRSHYLKKKRKRNWIIENKDKVFGPLP